ncbi:MAG: phosphatidylinositol dimannoside acyltransferase [Thermomicrobiales bacterium]|nr:phosphatidylinositol dimannoside acyltransferase [Thermomicrobiales bacterium]
MGRAAGTGSENDDPARASVVSRACYLIARMSSRVIRLLPRSLCLWGGNRVADVALVLARTYRANAMANFRQVLGPDVPAEEVRRTAHEAFRTSVQNMIDLLRFQRLTPAALARTIGVGEDHWSVIAAALSQGRGLILLTGHLGAFDSLSQLPAGRGYPMTVVLGRTLPRPIFDAAVALRQAHGMTVIEATPLGVRSLIEALRRGECVGFLGDRDFFGNGTLVEFFGRRTTLPSGAVRLARETGAPILAAYLRRTPTGYDLLLEEPFCVARTAHRNADVAAGMDRVVASLTRAVAATPGQWAMFQPVWPAGDASANSASRCASSS